MEELSYEQLTSLLRQKTMERMRETSELSAYKNQLDGLSYEEHDLVGRQDLAISKAKQEELSVHIENQLSPHKRKLSSLMKESEDLTASFREQASEVTEESIYNEMKKKSSVSVKTDKAMDSVYKSISNDLGERLTEKYLETLPSKNTPLSPKKLSRVAKRFESLGKKYSNSKDLNSGASSLVFSKMEEVIRPKLDNSGKGVLVLFLLGSVLILLAAKFVFPVVVIFLAVKLIRRVNKTSSYIRILAEYKVVRDNLSKVEEALKDRARKQYDNIIASLEDEYEVQLKEIEKNIELERGRIDAIRRNGESSFNFDETKLMSVFSNKISELGRHRNMLTKQIETSESKIVNLSSEIEELGVKVDQSLENLKLKYLDFSRMGESNEMMTTFLTDIKNGKPKMWEFKEGTTAMLYDDRDSALKFIRLISFQLRSNVNPFNLNITVYDERTLGTDFQQLTKEESTLFVVKSSSDDIKGDVDEKLKLIESRKPTMLRETDSIGEYNELMRSIDSVTEGYHILFILDPDESLRSSNQLSQILSVGPKLGVYPIILIATKELDKSYFSFLEKMEYMAEISMGEVKLRAREFILREMIKLDS